MKSIKELRNEIDKLELERKALSDTNVDIRKYPDLSGSEILKLRREESLAISNRLKKLRADLKALTDKEEEASFLKEVKALGYTFDEVIQLLGGKPATTTEGA